MIAFAAIGQAFKPLAKIKKQVWKGMSGAFKALGKASNPIRTFGKLMEILNVILLPINYFFTLLAALFLKFVGEYITDFIDILEDLGEMIENVAEWFKKLGIRIAEWWENDFLPWWSSFVDWLVNDIPAALMAFVAKIEDIISKIFIAIIAWLSGLWATWTGWMQTMLDKIKEWLDDVYKAFKKLVNKILNSLGGGGGSGGGGSGGGGGDLDPWWWVPTAPLVHSGSVSIPRTGYYKLQARERVIPKYGHDPSNAITINIEIKDSIVENRERLIKEIAETISMRMY